MPGHGHFEHTMLRSFMRLAWEPLLKHLAIDILNFSSNIAQQCAYTVTDHHKGWQTIMTFLFGTCDLLLTKFILDCQKYKKPATSVGYFEWVDSLPNKSFKFVSIIVFLCFGYFAFSLWCENK